MNELQVFNYGDFPVRTVLKDGDPWWVLGDVCRVLDLGSPHKVAERLDPDEKGRNLIPTPGGNQNMAIISEPGLYKVILQSRKPEAKDFSRWVTHEVLPAIRKTGMYGEPAAQVEEATTTVSLVNHETILRAAAIMATCPDSTRYVVNLLRNIDPNIDQTPTVTVQVEDKPIEIPKLSEPEAAVVKSTRTRKSRCEFFNYKKLQKIMKERRLYNTDLAQRISVDPSTVSTWRSGACPPNSSNRQKLCAALGVAPAYFDK